MLSTGDLLVSLKVLVDVAGGMLIVVSHGNESRALHSLERIAFSLSQQTLNMSPERVSIMNLLFDGILFVTIVRY